MKFKNGLYAFLVLLIIGVIGVLLYANFTVAPFITNVEINDSRKFEDKVVINVYVDNYFYKLNKKTWCLIDDAKAERPKKDDSRWVASVNGYCSYTEPSGDYNFYVKDKYGNINDINTQKVEINKLLGISFNKSTVYLYPTGKEKIFYELVTLGNIEESLSIVSANEGIATINEDNVITAVDYGETEIQVKDDNKVYGSLKVIVSPFITKPKIDFNKPYIKCGQFSAEDNILIDKILFDRVDEAGYGTRAGVVAAARFAALEFAYRIDYFYENGRLNNYEPFPKVDGEGRYYHRGFYLNESKFAELEKGTAYVGPATWGCDLKNFTNWGKWVYGRYYPNGLDCSGFVTWALLNGGFDIGDIGAGGDGSGEKSLPDMGTKLDISVEVMNSGRVKVGDLIGLEGHAAILAGWDDNNYYIAESLNTTGGVVITTVSRYKLEHRNSIYTFVVLMDDVYKKDGNLTNYWE